jgi:hypothetical protein
MCLSTVSAFKRHEIDRVAAAADDAADDDDTDTISCDVPSLTLSFPQRLLCVKRSNPATMLSCVLQRS